MQADIPGFFTVSSVAFVFVSPIAGAFVAPVVFSVVVVVFSVVAIVFSVVAVVFVLSGDVLGEVVAESGLVVVDGPCGVELAPTIESFYA